MGRSNQIRRTGADPDATTKATDRSSGFTVNPGPYEAIVRGHVVGSRMGQLTVTIPDLSGVYNEDDGSDSALVVSYASPFYGTTYGTDSAANPDNPAQAGQSYGMWMVPPDIGCKVLVTFVAGDLNRGYWFACIYDTPSHHMVPGISRHIGGSSKVSDPGDQLDSYIGSDSILPVVEHDTGNAGSFDPNALTNSYRYPHEIQAFNLIMQGLDTDPIRGAISSSSLRESPSNVYGISTPGRKATKNDQVPGNSQKTIFRKGGHQFVMDDGAEDGTDQLIRLRTSSGHQILMNDTEKVLYIGSSTGNQWLEFSPNGSINIFGAAGFNVRSQGPINMHSDAAIAMCAPVIKIDAVMGAKGISLPSVSITSQGSFTASAIMSATIKSNATLSLSTLGKASLKSGAALSISSAALTSVYGTILAIGAPSGVTSISGSLINLNCGTPAKPGIPLPVLPSIPKSHPDVVHLGGRWVPGSTVLSTCLTVPTHEPWERPAPKTS